MKLRMIGLAIFFTSILLTLGCALTPAQKQSYQISTAAYAHRYGVTWGNSEFVAVGEKGTILNSPDGTTWTIRRSPSEPPSPWTMSTSPSDPSLFGITWNGSQFVAVGNGVILTSSDGLKWTIRATEVPLLTTVIWNGSLFVAVGGFNVMREGYYLTSPPRGFTELLSYKLGLTQEGGRILTSPDGITWTDRTSEEVRKDALLDDVIWTGSQFVAVGGKMMGSSCCTSVVLRSPDGVTWTRHVLNKRLPLTSVAWNGSLFVAVGEAAAISTSPDGVTWTERKSGNAEILASVVWNGSFFVAVGGGFQAGKQSVILTSPDGITWTNRRSGTEGMLASVVWSGAMFVTVGKEGVILTSPDGVTWNAPLIDWKNYIPADQH